MVSKEKEQWKGSNFKAVERFPSWLVCYLKGGSGVQTTEALKFRKSAATRFVEIFG